jgi:hypothetical protein
MNNIDPLMVSLSQDGSIKISPQLAKRLEAIDQGDVEIMANANKCSNSSKCGDTTNMYGCTNRLTCGGNSNWSGCSNLGCNPGQQEN